MGNEYSMNVFICGNLSKGKDGILNNVIHKIFNDKKDKSDTKFEKRDYDFDIYLSYNRPLEDCKFYWVGHLFKQEISPELIQNICSGIQKMNEQYKQENCNQIDIRRNNVILCFLKENEDSTTIEKLIKTMNENLTLTEANNPIIVTVGGNNVDRDYEKLNKINRLPGGIMVIY